MLFPTLTNLPMLLFLLDELLGLEFELSDGFGDSVGFYDAVGFLLGCSMNSLGCCRIL